MCISSGPHMSCVQQFALPVLVDMCGGCLLEAMHTRPPCRLQGQSDKNAVTPEEHTDTFCSPDVTASQNLLNLSQCTPIVVCEARSAFVHLIAHPINFPLLIVSFLALWPRPVDPNLPGTAP